jgi:NAD(P)H-dependent FMN reductase
MVRIGIVVGSTRPGRRGDQVARWVHQVARDRGGSDVEYVVVDLRDHALPLLDEPQPAAIGEYQNAHTRRWSATIAELDGFVFVTPEYNHSMPAALKNAIDFLFAEWNDKAAGFVSYGLNGGTRAVEHLRLVLAEAKVACVRTQVALSLSSDFKIPDMRDPGRFTPSERQPALLERMLGEVGAWAGALQPLRTALVAN